LPAGFAEKFAVKAQTDRALTVQVTDDSQSNAPLQYLLQQGVRVKAFNEILPSFNEIFIRTVGETNEN
jgi:ABC-2 type transport system ATP-binding protein